MIIKVDLHTLTPVYKAKTEGEWAVYGAQFLADDIGEITYRDHIYYEPMTFHIPSGRYTPDFLHVCESGKLVFVEVKGSTKQRGYRSSLTKLKEARHTYPFFIWCMAVQQGGWSVKQI